MSLLKQLIDDLRVAKKYNKESLSYTIDELTTMAEEATKLESERDDLQKCYDACDVTIGAMSKDWDEAQTRIAQLTADLAAKDTEIESLVDESNGFAWLIQGGHYIAQSKDGDNCWVMIQTDGDEQPLHVPQKGIYNTVREAIGAAMMQLK